MRMIDTLWQTRNICWLASKLGLDACDGRLDKAHVGFSEHYLSKAPTGPKLSKEEANDPRIVRNICRKHHHQLDFGKLDIPRRCIPGSVWEFAEEKGLVAKLDREYP